MRGGGRKDEEENTKNDRWMKERRRPAFPRRETVDRSCDEGKGTG
jgi:hypothetical protein